LKVFLKRTFLTIVKICGTDLKKNWSGRKVFMPFGNTDLSCVLWNITQSQRVKKGGRGWR
jgi:hypothetical protein